MLLHTPLSQSRISSLDGLRSLAVLLVLAGHAASAVLEFHPGLERHWLFQFALIQYGWSGVDLFFILSGYLIANNLLSELCCSGKIQIGRFLIRRGLRIWPLYFFILAIAVVLIWPVNNLWPDIFLYTNYDGDQIVRGSWSLSIEQQFYLLFSLVLWLLGRRKNDLSLLSFFAIALFLLAPLVRYVTLIMQVEQLSFSAPLLVTKFLQLPFQTHYDSLLLGVLIAYFKLYHRRRCEATPALAVEAVMIGSGVALGILNPVLFGYTGFALIYGGLLWWTLSTSGRQNRWINFKYFALVSKLSYGVYLIHPFLLPHIAQRVSKNLQGEDATILFAVIFCSLGIASFALSFCSYLLIEKPFLRLRENDTPSILKNCL